MTAVLPFKVNLSGKVAVVTGGAGVLGQSFALALAACGARIALIDLNLDAAEAAAKALENEGYEAMACAANVLETASLAEAAAEVEVRFGPCDILLNGAGGNHPRGTTTKEVFSAADLDDPSLRTFFDLDPESVGFVFNLNFLGTLVPTQVFARQMIGRDGCSVINVSSMNAFRPLTKIPAYSGAKAAISNFTQWLAVHFAEAGIRVNALAPGFFITNQNRAMLVDEAGAFTDRARKIIDHTPMRRFGAADELTGALLFLASNAASGFVNGAVLPIDGGFAAYSGV